MRTEYAGLIDEKFLGQTVTLYGWAHRRRDHGGVIFIDLRDREGLVQIVCDPDRPDVFETADKVRNEFVVEVKGLVRARPEGTRNENLISGGIEVLAQELKILNPSAPPPFLLDDENLSETTRLTYRVLDLRRLPMQRNMKLRYKAAMAFRRFLDKHGFIDIETPMLTKSTPEGARDYLVPSRIHDGHFYALPQSPQLFKQMLMCAGFDRYYQIVKCFRDEDLRADRQPEFTQVDIEMSFADEKQVMDMAEGLMIRVFKEALGADIPAPFPRMTWDEAMSRYGVDKPDTRFGLELQDVTSIVSNSGFKLFASAKLVKAMRVPGGENLTRKEIDELTEFVKIYGAQGLAWIKIRENEWQSPIAKFLSDEERAGLTEALGLSVGDIVFFQAGEPGMVNAALGNLRVHLGEKLGLIPENELTRGAGIPMDRRTNGAIVYENMETMAPGIFACGNVVHVHDLVDFVSAESEKAGAAAARYALGLRHGHSARRKRQAQPLRPRHPRPARSHAAPVSDKIIALNHAGRHNLCLPAYYS